MANHVSSLKRARQTITKTAINRANKSKLRGALRLMREALTAADKKTITGVYRTTVSVLDRSVQKGVLHKNTASRYRTKGPAYAGPLTMEILFHGGSSAAWNFFPASLPSRPDSAA